MLVKDVMTTSVLAVEPDTSLQEAISKMTQAGRSCLVIVSDHKPVGIVTERDVAKAFSHFLKEQKSGDTIESIMTPNPVCLTGNTTYEYALTLSRSRKMRHLPVIGEEYQLIGLVTQTDLVEHYAYLLSKQTALESCVEELRLLSLEDPLLGIGNRRAMDVELNHIAAEARRYQKVYSVALFDIDYFKKYNDFYGHEAGDQVLREVAQAIKKSIRGEDRVFRYGGEEILVLMPETNDQVAPACAERIRKTIESLAIEHKDAPLGKVTVSGGTASFDGFYGNIIKQADDALYKAKSQGRNCICTTQ